MSRPQFSAPVERPADTVRRESGTHAQLTSGAQTITSDGTEQTLFSLSVGATNGIGVEILSWGYDQAPPADPVFVRAFVLDSGTTEAAFYANGPGAVAFDPEVPAFQGWDVEIRVTSPSSNSDVDMQGALTYTER